MKGILPSRVRLMCIVALTGLLFSCSDDSSSNNDNADAAHSDVDATDISDGDVNPPGDDADAASEGDALDGGDDALNDGVDAPVSCVRESECGSGYLCDFGAEQCAVSCTADPAICSLGKSCVERADGRGGSICKVEDTSNPECNAEIPCDSGDECVDGECVPESSTDECSAENPCTGANETCVDNECVVTSTGETHFFATISDVSGPTCDDSASDPGSDIFAVELTNAQGVYSAYAVNANILGTDNQYASPYSILDGTEASLEGDCPAATGFDRWVSLGCNGDVVVKFVDDTGAQVEIQDGDTITVYEYAEFCGGDQADTWQLAVCAPDTTESDLLTDSSACNGTAQGSPSAGINSVTVSF